MRSTQRNKKPSNFRKEDANRKSSILFTQLGLVLALLLTYIAIEFKTPVNNDITGYIPPTYETEDMIPDTTPEEPKQEKSETRAIPERTLENLDILDNDATDEEVIIDIDKIDPDSAVDVNPDIIPYIPIDEDIVEDVPFRIIEHAPLFPGCKGTKEELKQCFSERVKKLVGRKFNGDIAQDIGLSVGKKKIFVQFTVDKQGNIADVMVRAPHKRLEKEARRVVNLLPKMTPGKQRGRSVGVKFILPITFMVE